MARKNIITLLLLILISTLIYLPWRNNPLIFDDVHIINSPEIFEYAQNPISLKPRNFPYFTLGFESLIFDRDYKFSRYVTLILHAINGFILFLLGQQILKKIISAEKSFLTALSISVIFIVHPVAVYAVGYLVQRTILIATLFLLLSALYFDKAISNRSWQYAMLSGIYFGFAVLSKEHALFGIPAVLGILLIHPSFAESRRKAIILSFLVTALPFALWTISLKLGIFATAYEPDAQSLINASGFPNAGTRFGNWLLSASLQCLFFFRSLVFWYWPDPSGMSIDIRPDFIFLSDFTLVALGPLAFLTLAGVVAFLLSSRRVRPELKLAGYGLLWAMALFLVELSTVRFQEPIVLYRSYLWAPGFLLALGSLVCIIPARLAIAAASISALVLAPLAWGRLLTFSDELLLWKEAALHLPTPSSPGAIRIHYNLGIFHARAGNMDEALQDFEWVIRHDPKEFGGYWGRSSIHLYRNELALAANDLDTVIKLKPDFGMAYYQYGMVLKQLQKPAESAMALSKAGELGIWITNLN